MVVGVSSRSALVWLGFVLLSSSCTTRSVGQDGGGEAEDDGESGEAGSDGGVGDGGTGSDGDDTGGEAEAGGDTGERPCPGCPSDCPDEPTGTVLWEHEVGTRVTTVAVGSAREVVASTWINQLALWRWSKDGVLDWTIPADHEFLTRSIHILEDGDIVLSDTSPEPTASVRRYDRDGGLLWQLDTNSFEPGRVAIAEDGTIYWGRFSSGMVLDAISGTGEPLWTVEIDSVPRLGGSLAVDDVGGGVVIGSSTGGDPTDAWVARFVGEGEVWWDAAYDGPGSGRDYVSEIAIDSRGNIIAAGTVEQPADAPSRAFARWIGKLDADGDLIWANVGATDVGPWVYGLAIDPRDDAIVVATDEGALSLATDAHELWTWTAQDLGHDEGAIGPVAIDACGDVALTLGTADSGHVLKVAG